MRVCYPAHLSVREAIKRIKRRIWPAKTGPNPFSPPAHPSPSPTPLLLTPAHSASPHPLIHIFLPSPLPSTIGNTTSTYPPTALPPFHLHHSLYTLVPSPIPPPTCPYLIKLSNSNPYVNYFHEHTRIHRSSPSFPPFIMTLLHPQTQYNQPISTHCLTQHHPLPRHKALYPHQSTRTPHTFHLHPPPLLNPQQPPPDLSPPITASTTHPLTPPSIPPPPGTPH